MGHARTSQKDRCLDDFDCGGLPKCSHPLRVSGKSRLLNNCCKRVYGQMMKQASVFLDDPRRQEAARRESDIYALGQHY
jgi:hypothetical protein